MTYKVDQNQNRQQEERYAYDRRGNLTEIYRNGQLVNRYQFGALNRLEAAMDYQNHIGAVYQYNGVGHRIGKTEGICKEPMLPTARLDSMNLSPTRQIEDVLDLTKQYHNLLQRTEGETKNCYTWDHNVLAATGTDGTSQSYIQDELGSPIRLMDEVGKVRQSYGYDEFGNDLYHSQSEIQPFGYTGYQRDGVAKTYYAQAREYRPEMGRFISEDVVKGHGAYPLTLNHYSYCWSNPHKLIDPNGQFPILVIPIIIGTGLLLSGCSKPQVPDVELPPATNGYKYDHNAGEYDSRNNRDRTNCYAYAFDIVDNPMSGTPLKTRGEAGSQYNWALQPGMMIGQYDYGNYDYYVAGNDGGNEFLYRLVEADVEAMGYNIKEYQPGMEGGYAIVLVVKPGVDYHFYRENGDGTWSHKRGTKKVDTGVTNPIEDAFDRGYTSIVGCYYITKKEGCP